jgi:hypothetical protein
MFDAFFASNTSPSLLSRSTVAASLLHLIVVVVTIEVTTARPHTVHRRAWVPPAPVVPPQVPDLPHMPTVDAAALMRHPLHIIALAGMAPTDVPLARRPGITSEVQLEYVIVHTGRCRLGSVRVIATTDAALAVSSIDPVLGASFKPALRARWWGRQTIRFQDG